MRGARSRSVCNTDSILDRDRPAACEGGRRSTPSGPRVDRSLRGAIDSLRHKHDKKSGISDDPNEWDAWADEPYNLIRHLRRLVYVSVKSDRIINQLPLSLPHES